MKNKARLAFEMLEREMEVVLKQDMTSVIGGVGDGDLEWPLILMATIITDRQVQKAGLHILRWKE